jgi:predicted metal-dependent enzyme (double-stranded beta helix superfamily)
MKFMTTIEKSQSTSSGLGRLRSFVVAFNELVDSNPEEAVLLRVGSSLLKGLVSEDNWLPMEYAEPDPNRYRQYLLHVDPQERFSIVSFVWGPGQTTPIHNHTVWGLIGMLRGAEREQHFTRADDGTLREHGETHLLTPGAVDAVSPTIGDLHRVSNAFDDRVSISVHVYGANIGKVRRSVYELDGSQKSFVSGYSNAAPPNLLDARA